MVRLTCALALLLVVAPGCHLASNCYDGAYGYYGGCWQREDLFCGRVGTAFSSGSGRVHHVPHAAVVETIEEIEPGIEIREARRIHKSYAEPVETLAPAETRPRLDDLPEPDDRPPAAEELQNVLRAGL